MKKNYYTQTNNKINMKLVEYSLLKKYVSGIDCIKFAYEKNQAGLSIHTILLSPLFEDILFKENILFNFMKKVPRPNVKYEDLKPNKPNIKKFKNVYEGILRIKNNPIILNLYSEVGEQGLQASSCLVEILKENKYKVNTMSGSKLNSMLLNFDDTDDSDVTKLVDTYDVIVIFSFNSFINKDYREKSFNSLVEYCYESNKPIIISSKSEFKSTSNNKIVNIKFNDEYKNEQELILDIFGSGD